MTQSTALTPTIKRWTITTSTNGYGPSTNGGGTNKDLPGTVGCSSQWLPSWEHSNSSLMTSNPTLIMHHGETTSHQLHPNSTHISHTLPRCASLISSSWHKSSLLVNLIWETSQLSTWTTSKPSSTHGYVSSTWPLTTPSPSDGLSLLAQSTSSSGWSIWPNGSSVKTMDQGKMEETKGETDKCLFLEQ